MAAPGLAPAPSSGNTNLEQRPQVEAALKGSASWFVVIAGLSLVNSVLAMTGANLQFIFGLGFTQVVDALAHEGGKAALMLDLFINGIVAGVFTLFWNFARKGAKWAWVAGMALYTLDGLILLPFKDFLGLAFHAYALYRMYSGYKLVPEFWRLNSAAVNQTVSSSL